MALAPRCDTPCDLPGERRPGSIKLQVIEKPPVRVDDLHQFEPRCRQARRLELQYFGRPATKVAGLVWLSGAFLDYLRAIEGGGEHGQCSQFRLELANQALEVQRERHLT